MATRSRRAPADGVRPAPLFSVLVGYETLHGRICELENGTVLAPGALVPWLESAYFERAIFSLGTRVDVSARPGSSAAAPAGPSSCATGSARTRTATSPPSAAKVTTSSPTPRVGRPPRTTAGCSVASTTGCATNASAHRPRRPERGSGAASAPKPTACDPLRRTLLRRRADEQPVSQVHRVAFGSGPRDARANHRWQDLPRAVASHGRRRRGRPSPDRTRWPAPRDRDRPRDGTSRHRGRRPPCHGTGKGTVVAAPMAVAISSDPGKQ